MSRSRVGLRPGNLLGGLLLLVGLGAVAAPVNAEPPPPPQAADPVQMVNSVGMTLIKVEPGTYWRGSPPQETGHRANETRHEVTLTRGYWLGQTEVTQAQYEAVMDRNPSAFAGADHPVENVPWFDWIEFCNRLSELEGLQPVYTIDQVHVTWNQAASGYRLPTEAEWEHACRSGTETRFHVGNRSSQLLEVAWFRANSDWQTRPVAAKPDNPWGFFDMHGNVFEWCWDLYAAYPGHAMVDPTGAELGARRVLRGGGWGSYSQGCRSAFRQASEPSARRAWYGARIARNVEQVQD